MGEGARRAGEGSLMWLTTMGILPSSSAPLNLLPRCESWRGLHKLHMRWPCFSRRPTAVPLARRARGFHPRPQSASSGSALADRASAAAASASGPPHALSLGRIALVVAVCAYPVVRAHRIAREVAFLHRHMRKAGISAWRAGGSRYDRKEFIAGGAIRCREGVIRRVLPGDWRVNSGPLLPRQLW